MRLRAGAVLVGEWHRTKHQVSVLKRSSRTGGIHTCSRLPVSYRFASSGGRSASVSSTSASQSTHARPVKVSLTASDSARMTGCE